MHEIYKKWLSESKIDNWRKYASGNSYVDVITALMLENQRLAAVWPLIPRRKAEATPRAVHAHVRAREKFDAKIYQLVADVVPNLIAHKIVSVQPMLGPVTQAWYTDRDGQLQQDAVPAKTRMIGVRTTQPDLPSAIIQHLDREILTDIKNNVGTVLKCGSDNTQSVLNAVVSAVLHVRKKANRQNQPCWVVANQEIVQKYDLTGDAVYPVAAGTFPENQILVGCKDKDFDSDGPQYGASYIWLPYIMFTPAETQIMIRYSKKLVRGGSESYAKVVIPADENFDQLKIKASVQ